MTWEICDSTDVYRTGVVDLLGFSLCAFKTLFFRALSDCWVPAVVPASWCWVCDTCSKPLAPSALSEAMELGSELQIHPAPTVRLEKDVLKGSSLLKKQHNYEQFENQMSLLRDTVTFTHRVTFTETLPQIISCLTPSAGHWLSTQERQLTPPEGNVKLKLKYSWNNQTSHCCNKASKFSSHPLSFVLSWQVEQTLEK